MWGISWGKSELDRQLSSQTVPERTENNSLSAVSSVGQGRRVVYVRIQYSANLVQWMSDESWIALWNLLAMASQVTVTLTMEILKNVKLWSLSKGTRESEAFSIVDSGFFGSKTWLSAVYKGTLYS